MKCPSCMENLVISERQGIEIDYCPRCRGVWLDRGELDKILERSHSQAEKPRSAFGPEHSQERHYDKDKYRPEYKKRKREGFLDDLFDF